MIVIRYGRRPVLQSPAGEADGGGGATLNIDDGDDTASGGEDTLDGSEDRGDEVDPAIDAKLLEKVAAGADGDSGDDTTEGADGTDGGKKKNEFVPVGRFNQVNEEKKRLERENEDLRKRAGAPAVPAATPAPTPPPKPAFDEDKAELEYAQLLAEGEFEKAVAKRKEINTHVREQARDEAERNVESRRTQRETVTTLTQVAEKAVQDFPYLDTEDGAATMDLILAARDGFAAKGMPLPEALAKAVKEIAPKFAPAATGAAPATPGKDSTKKLDGTDTRSQQANARGAADSTKQPPKLDGGAGNRAGKQTADVEDMTDDQFAALPEAEKRRLRGDEG